MPSTQERICRFLGILVVTAFAALAFAFPYSLRMEARSTEDAIGNAGKLERQADHDAFMRGFILVLAAQGQDAANAAALLSAHSKSDRETAKEDGGVGCRTILAYETAEAADDAVGRAVASGSTDPRSHDYGVRTAFYKDDVKRIADAHSLCQDEIFASHSIMEGK